MPSKTVVNFYEDDTSADDFTEYCEQHGIVVPADIVDDPYPSGESESYSEACQERRDDFCCNDSSPLVVISVVERDA